MAGKTARRFAGRASTHRATVAGVGAYRAYLAASPPTDGAVDAAVTLGLEFYTPNTAATVTHIHFWQPVTTASASARTVGVFTAAGVQVGATQSLTPSGSGWQTATLSAPIALTANTRYRAVVYHPDGGYVTTASWFGGGGAGSVDLVNGSLIVPSAANATGAVQGTYRYATGISSPTSGFNNANYWVDLTITAGVSGPPVLTLRGTSTLNAAGAKPGPTNTGVPAGTVLTAYTGPTDITIAGTVIDSKDISTNIKILAANVTIRNCKIHGDSDPAGIGIDDGNAYNLTLTDCEIYDFGTALVYGGWTATRLHIHSTTYDGIKMSSGATLRDSWIHAPNMAPTAHWDGIQIQNGVTDVIIQHNVIDVTDGLGSDCIFFAPDLPPSTDGPVLIDGNWFYGGNYTIYIVHGYGGYSVQNITVTNNRFGRVSSYGPCDRDVPITQSGNVWDDDGSPLIL